jgi:hypothetical protein
MSYKLIPPTPLLRRRRRRLYKHMTDEFGVLEETIQVSYSPLYLQYIGGEIQIHVCL